MPYIIYDTEGTGTNKRFDRPTQFAALVVDDNFSVIDSINIRGRLPHHVLPHPKALEVTKTNPFDLEQAELSPLEFAQEIHQFMSKHRPCQFLGQNIIAYDEELLRSLFYMSLLDPYITSAKGCTRIDTLPLLRFIYSCNPNAFKTEKTEEGMPIFKLDQIAPLNGFKNHHAHDALGDDYATLFVFKYLKDHAPKEFEEIMKTTNAQFVESLCAPNPSMLKPLFFVNPYKKLEVQSVIAIGHHKRNIALFNLDANLEEWIALSKEEILEKIYPSKEKTLFTEDGDSEEEKPEDCGIFFISSNKQPMITDKNFWNKPVDETILEKNKELLKAHPEFLLKMNWVCENRYASFKKNETTQKKIEEKIYDDFASYQDKNIMQAFHREADWAKRLEIAKAFKNPTFQHIAKLLAYQENLESFSEETQKNYFEILKKERLFNNSGEWLSFDKAFEEIETLENSEIKDIIKNYYKAKKEKIMAL